MIEVLVRHVFEATAPAARTVSVKSISDDVLGFIAKGSPEDVLSLASFLTGVSAALNEPPAQNQNEHQEE